MTDLRLAAIVSSYNRLTLMQQGLPSLYEALAQCPFPTVIMVFEAGSTDGSQQWLEEFRQQNEKVSLEVVKPDSEGDNSFSAGVNTACSLALEKYPDVTYYLFFETDNWIKGPQPILLASRLLENDDRLAAVGFTVRKYSGAGAGYGCSFPTVGQFLIGQHLTCILHLDAPKIHWQSSDTLRWTTCDVVFTSPLLIKRSAWEESHGFDQRTFPFSDCDTDWCRRLADLGWRLAVVETDAVVHDNKEQISQWSSKRAIQFHMARLKYLRMHVGGWVNMLKPLLFIRHCLEYIFVLLLVSLGKRPKTVLEMRKDLVTTVFNDYCQS